MTNVTFGWKAGAEQYAPSRLLEYAVAAEEAGFEMLDVSDHFHPWDPAGQASFIWTWLGAVAVKTSRIQIGPGVTCPILRYHPSIIAQAAATVGAMAPGRTYLAVGTGEALNEYAAVGRWPEHPERQAMLGEAIELMRKLWDGEPVTHKGTYYETHKAQLFTRPEQPPPIYISTMTPASASFAGKMGDGLFTVGGEEPDTYRQLIANFDNAAREAGKNPDSMPKVIEVQVAFTEDEQGAIEHFQQYWASTTLPALFNRKIYSPEEAAMNGKVVGADTVRDMLCISTDPAKHEAHLRPYMDLGFTHIVLHCPGPDQMAFIQGYGREVLPRLRSMRAAA